jgi:hypothetical protein
MPWQKRRDYYVIIQYYAVFCLPRHRLETPPVLFFCQVVKKADRETAPI